jgi:hypothetical protein
MKLRTKNILQPTKRINMDATSSSTIVTPVKQRRLANEMVNTIKTANTMENISSHSVLNANTSTGFKTSMMVSFFFF